MLTQADVSMQRLPPSVKKVIVIATDPFRAKKSTEKIEFPGESLADIIVSDISNWRDESTILQAVETIESFTLGNQSLPTDHYLFGIFSSGTSGTGGHKGVLVRENIFREHNIVMANFEFPLVACLKSSPTWASGNDIIWQSLLSGGRIGFVTARSKATSSIWNHIHSIKPTWKLSFVPALVTDLMEEYSQAYEFFRQCNLQPNKANDKATEKHTHWARAKAAEYLYSCLGGSICMISVGGAMVNQAHVEFLSRVLPCEIYQGYGSTEGGGLATANHNDNKLMPFRDVKFRVESRPDLGYTMEDKPFPRGELLVLGKETACAEDWFGDEQTVQDQKKKYSDDGYYCTDDIVEYYKDANSFRIVDRVSSLVKLPDGIFFSPHRVEATIGDLTLYGISEFLVAATPQGIVVLILETAPPAAKPSSNHATVLVEVQRRCRESYIDERFIPRHLIIDPRNSGSSKEHRWKNSGCYTVSEKLIRQRVHDRVKDQLIELDKMDKFDPLASPVGTLGKEKEAALSLFDAIGIPRDSASDTDDIELLPLERLGVNSLLWGTLLFRFIRKI